MAIPSHNFKFNYMNYAHGEVIRIEEAKHNLQKHCKSEAEYLFHLNSAIKLARESYLSFPEAVDKEIEAMSAANHINTNIFTKNHQRQEQAALNAIISPEQQAEMTHTGNLALNPLTDEEVETAAAKKLTCHYCKRRPGKRLRWDGKTMKKVAICGNCTTMQNPSGTINYGDHKLVGRNEKCPCGSGKKYKKCCYNPENPLLRKIE